MMKFLVASALVGVAAAAKHTAVPYAVADGTVISDDNDPGTKGSFNPLQIDPIKHEPYLEINADRRMTISVRGTDGATDGAGLHPQAFGSHWIEFVFVTDQDSNVVCKYNFTADDAKPTHDCEDPLGVNVTSVTSYEYCNLHGLWVGPKLNVAWEVAAATLLERTTQSETVAPDYYSSSTVEGAPVKHQPAVVASGDGYSIAVLGTDGTGLHPHVYDTHYIEAVYARDQHDSVAVYQELGANVDTAQSLVFTVPQSSISLRPFEFCNLHGLWVGELVETASDDTTTAVETTDASDDDTDGTLVAAASVAAVAAATAASVCL